MLLTADETQSSFGTAMVVIILSGAAIYAFGYVRAVMHRANRDYKTTKAAVPGLRRGYWGAWWRAVKRGLLLMVILTIVIYVMVKGRDGNNADANVTPTPTGTHSSR